MTDLGRQLAELAELVAAGRVPAELGAALRDRVLLSATAAERRDLRDRLLVAAARALDPDGSTWSRALRVRAELEALERRASLDPARRLLADADRAARVPRGQRRLCAILQPGPSRVQTPSGEG